MASAENNPYATPYMTQPVELLRDRPKYQRSGKVNWLRLLPLLLVPVVTSLLLACLLALVFAWGHYYSIIVPLAASMPVAGATYLTIRWAHCRNRFVAGLVGLLAGMVLFPGWYHVDFISVEGPQVAARFDLLPQYIVFRMQTDAEVDAQGLADRPDVIGNWLMFVLELLLVNTFAVGAAVYRASRAYCESCGRWMRLALATGPPDAGTAIAEALACGTLAHLPPVPQLQRNSSYASTTVSVEACRKLKADSACPTYLTIVETGGQRLLFAPKKRELIKQGAITVDELSVLAEKMTALKPVAPLVETIIPLASTSSPQTAQLATGIVETLPPERVANVYTKRNATIAIMLSLMPIGVLLAGVIMIGIGVWQLFWGGQADVVQLIVVALLFAVGSLSAVFGVTMCVVNVDYFNMQYGHWVTKNELKLRPDCWVNPDDPRAVYVEVVPREHWTDIVADKANDGGFLLVDEASLQLVFEGAKQRYRIPGEAITLCEAEITQPQAGAMGFFATVVQAHVSEQGNSAQAQASPTVWEAPFMVRPVSFVRYNGAFRRRSAEQLRDSIRRLSFVNYGTTMPHRPM